MSKSKYHNKETYVGEIKFQSIKEAKYFCHLRTLEERGEIKDLRLQVPYEIIPAVGKQRPTYYIADFVYTDVETGEELVVDVKSSATRKKESYRLKKKMMLAFNGIALTEVVLD